MQLVCVDHSGKRDADTLSADRFGKEVGISREERPSVDRGAVEKLGIIQPAGAIPMGGEDVDTPDPETISDRERDVNIHV